MMFAAPQSGQLMSMVRMSIVGVSWSLPVGMSLLRLVMLEYNTCKRIRLSRSVDLVLFAR